MRSRAHTVTRGYSLVELLIAMALGLIVLGAAVQIYSKAMDVTWVVSQRAEVQQDARAAENLIVKDVSLANAGFSDSAQYLHTALASGTGNNPRYGCDYTGACHLGANNTASRTFPQITAGVTVTNYMFGVVPGCSQGITVNAGPTDIITVASLDRVFLLNDYTVRFNDANGNSVTFKVPTPAPNPLPQAVNDSAFGLQQGDLVLFQGGTSAAIAEVTTPAPVGVGPPYTVLFGDGSPLLFNQNGATSGNLSKAIIQGKAALMNTDLTTVTATRVWVSTYYLDNTTGTPTLMRIVNARKPVAVAENVVDLRFVYDTYSDAGVFSAGNCDANWSATPKVYPYSIRTVNLSHLTFRSVVKGKGYQAVDMHTKISVRNMGFINRYQ